MEIKRAKDIAVVLADKCHDGEGILLCKKLITGYDCEGIGLMHLDELPAGVSIGVHEHITNEEAYYLLSGKGILTYDGAEFEMLTGDISVCKPGHSHAFKATENCVLIVVGGVHND